MKTLRDVHADCRKAGFPLAYWGEREHWFVTLGRSRDSDALEESNFRVLLKRLGGESDTIAIERESHWACGWVETLLVDPADTAKGLIAEAALGALGDYAILDEEDFSHLEYDRFHEYAESELSQYDGGWEEVLAELQNDGNYFIGEGSSESQLIEDAREILEDRQHYFDDHAFSPIDPGQMLLFA